MAQHRDLVKGLQEIECVLEGLLFVTAQLYSLELMLLDMAVYHPSNGVGEFDCVSEKPVLGVPPGLARKL